MKNLLSKILFGRDRLSGLIAFAVIGSIALGCNCKDLANTNSNGTSTSNSANSTATGDPDMPDDVLLKALVKETTADFAYAISTEDFSKMYEKASKDFKEQYTAAQMKDVFKSTIANKRALMPMLAKIVTMDPQYSPAPSIRKEQNVPILVVEGTYDTKPKALKFSYEYVKRDGRFKLLKLVLGDDK